jgi:hypothetical protein
VGATTPVRPVLKASCGSGRVAQVVECLLNKCEALSSRAHTAKKLKIKKIEAPCIGKHTLKSVLQIATLNRSLFYK